MKMIFDLDMGKCVACGACAIACMDQNDLWPNKGDSAYRKIASMDGERKGEIRYFSLACLHCTDAACVSACPVCCISKDQNGLTVYDSSLCIGCHSCAMACPYGVPDYGADGKLSKCTGCATRVENGLEPACVRVCPTKALILVPEDEYAKRKPEDSLRDISLR